MPINTDLNISPYFDDYNEKDDYYKVLFKPGVAVQVRELNQLQTILQKQIERFGDNIFKRGTIIDGCNFIFHNPLPYAKLADLETDGTPVNISAFKGFLVKNTANLIAQVVETSTGFEATDPDLNTIFIKYLNHGATGSSIAFSPNQILTFYRPELSVIDADITVKSSNFSNTDIPVFLSAIEVQNSTGGQNFVNSIASACNFSVGEIITQSITGARAVITQVNATAKVDTLILKIRPLASELRMSNTNSWAFIDGYSFLSETSKITANLFSSIGSGAKGSIITDSITGGVLSLIITAGGSGYYVEPYLTIQYSTANVSSAANTLIDALKITPKTYAAQISVNGAFSAIGSGYGFGVGSGIIYQKGYFSRVSENFVVVEKYSTSTNNVVGFDTEESIVDYTSDFNLYDNATGTFNKNAPGANRLKLSPVLTVLTKDEASANDTFFTIVEFSEGKPFKQNKTTQFNTINKQFAQRTVEESGDFVIDQFLMNTTGQETFADEKDYFEVSIDPGLAYIDGFRVETSSSYYKNIRKGTNTEISNTAVSINYGNYVRVKELGGNFRFSVGTTVNLRDTASGYLSNAAIWATYSTGGSPTIPNPFAFSTALLGTVIGNARIRSLVLVSGSPGDPSAQYNLYLFDIRMNNGKNFKSVRSIYYDGLSVINSGLCDIVLTGTDAVIYEPQNSSLLYYSGSSALKNANNLSYTYKAFITPLETSLNSTTGIVSYSVASNPGEYFPYNSTLTDAQKLTVLVTPSSNTICANAGSYVTVTAGFGNIIGTSTSFNTIFQTGDWVRLGNSAALHQMKRISSVTNATHMVSSTPIANGYTFANIALAFPQNISIPLSLRNNRTVTVTSNTTISIDIGNTVSIAFSSISFNVQKTTVPVAKSVTRKVFVKINTASNIASNKGPWCLGISDIVRLRNVYLGSTTADTNITSNFWIDHNQKKDYYDVGFLYKKTDYALSAAVTLLVEFDVLTTTQNGLKTISSYPINDTVLLTDSSTSINTVEVPEMYNDNDEYFDLINYLDFRPYSSNTANLANTAAGATTNPIEPTITNRFDTVNDKKFPAPQSDCTLTIEKYLGRADAVIISSNGDFRTIEGIPSKSPKIPDVPQEGLLINYLIIPPYPSLPRINSSNTSLFLDKKISNIKFTNKRKTDYTVTTPIDMQGLAISQPKRYTMKEIGALERRINNLEYYTSLSATEDSINSLKIGGSANSSVERFKFGFFVDNFTTTDYAEINDPSYKAQIYGYELHPTKKQVQIKYAININDAVTSSCLNGGKILLPTLKRNRIIGQSIATEATTVEVAVTETTQTISGAQVQSTQTIIKEITKTDFISATGSTNKAKTSTVADTNGSFAATSVNVKTFTVGFEVGKLAGTITANGGKQKDRSYGFPQLERYVNGVWSVVAYGNKTSNMTWSLSYSYVPNAGATDRQFRIFAPTKTNNISLYAGGSYPRSKDVITYDIVSTSTVDPSTSKTTITTVIPSTIIVESTSSITKALFNSKLSGLMTIDNVFNTTGNLNSPFIDLAAAIQRDINS